MRGQSSKVCLAEGLDLVGSFSVTKKKLEILNIYMHHRAAESLPAYIQQ